MMEEEWQGCTDPTPMFEFLRGKASDRKLRLFAVACSRRIEQWMSDVRSRHAIEVSEQYADHRIGRKVLASARRAAFSASKEAESSQLAGRSYSPGHASAIVALHVSSAPEENASVMLGQATAGCANGLVFHYEGTNAGWLNLACQAALLREVFGNPFRSITLNATCHTPSALSLGRAAYDNRIMPAGTLERERLAVLADALEEARCDNTDILTHLRGPGPHVRGCWALDLVLGKE